MFVPKLNARLAATARVVRDESGQATAEYALVLVAAAAVAVALITWVAGSDALPAMFNAVIRRIRSYV